jgi:hypothetical protein
VRALRRRVSLLLGASIGAGLAVVVIARGSWPPASQAEPLRLATLAFRDNKQHLSRAETAKLLRWANRYRSCAARHGVLLGPVTAGRDEVVIAGRRHTKIRQPDFRRQLPCVRELGDPPPFSAFVLMSDRFLHLYRPRTCRLPVVAPAQA